MKLRSLIALTACSILAGLVVSVSTAWGFAWTEGSRARKGEVVSGKATRSKLPVGFTASIVPGIQRYEVLQMEPLEGVPEIRSREPANTLPGWVDFRSDAALTTVGYGWPLPCVKARNISENGWQVSSEGWLRIGPVGNQRSVRRLPLIPIAGGLFVNTLAVAIPLVLLFVGARYVVAEHRRRAGRCVGCGYNIEGIPGGCPECGAVRETRPMKPDEAAT